MQPSHIKCHGDPDSQTPAQNARKLCGNASALISPTQSSSSADSTVSPPTAKPISTSHRRKKPSAAPKAKQRTSYRFRRRPAMNGRTRRHNRSRRANPHVGKASPNEHHHKVLSLEPERAIRTRNGVCTGAPRPRGHVTLPSRADPALPEVPSHYEPHADTPNKRSCPSASFHPFACAHSPPTFPDLSNDHTPRTPVVLSRCHLLQLLHLATPSSFPATPARTTTIPPSPETRHIS